MSVGATLRPRLQQLFNQIQKLLGRDQAFQFGWHKRCFALSAVLDVGINLVTVTNCVGIAAIA